MYDQTDNPLLKAEIKAEDPKFFWCDNWNCGKRIYEGDKYKLHESGMKVCVKCGRLYAKEGEEKICTKEDCE